jgi:hypothetical protein
LLKNNRKKDYNSVKFGINKNELASRSRIYGVNGEGSAKKALTSHVHEGAEAPCLVEGGID